MQRAGIAGRGRVLSPGAAPRPAAPSPARRIRRSSSGVPDSGGPLRGHPATAPRRHPAGLGRARSRALAPQRGVVGGV